MTTAAAVARSSIRMGGNQPGYDATAPCAWPGRDRRAMRMRPYHVAIVGSGPSGYFAAASLLKFADVRDRRRSDVRVDMLEMLPTPWGLVRSGVAPDHPKIKSISAQFEKTALDPRFRFFGNIVVGEHVHRRRAGRALRRGDLRRRRPVRSGAGASPARTCPAAWPPSTSSAGTTRIRTSRRWPPTCRPDAPSWSATATSPSTWLASWSPTPTCWPPPTSPITR